MSYEQEEKTAVVAVEKVYTDKPSKRNSAKEMEGVKATLKF